MITDEWNIAEMMRLRHVPGLSMAFIKDGMLQRSECHGEMEAGRGQAVQADTMFNACSISKFAASLLALLLVEQKVLGLDEDIRPYLTSWTIPEHPSYESRAVTLRRLLSHQAGFADPKGGHGEYVREQGIPAMPQLLEGTTPYSPEPAALTAEPGSQFIYSDTGFGVLQLLIEDVTGVSFGQLLQDRIFEPLHMNNSRIVLADAEIRAGSASGHNKHGERLCKPYPIYPYPAAAGLWTTPTDLALLMVELLASLQGEGKLGISAETAGEMIRPQGCFKWTGLGVFLEPSSEGLEISSLGWGSGFQCMMIAYPETRRGGVWMMNADPGVHQTKSLLGQVAMLWQQGQFN
ncbi:serine hydrolase [Paenibacillus chibensis]|uniref:Serine hydrolase n=1 Tax=Paenibacillus chibensis TaxID=59846 RepID=A0ABU6PTB4_9BACL|nr:serine hydrolase [Paenibacillus chibensis]